MYRIACCDDMVISLDNMAQMTAQIMKERKIPYTLSCFRAPGELLAAFTQEGPQPFDLLLLDVLLEGGENGVELARSIRALDAEVAIIFITCSADFALAGYDVYPIHYLLKPVDPVQLNEAIGYALLRRIRVSTLTVRSRDMQRTIPTKTIHYIEVFNYHIIIHTTEEDIPSTGHLTDLMEKLPADQFLRCHKSYLVNLAFVTGIRRYKLELKGGHLLPVSKQNYRDIQQAFCNYCEGLLPMI